MNNRAEIDRLFILEYGERSELIFRFCGVVCGSAMLFAYTGWWAAGIWGAVFVALHAVYFQFLRSRSAEPSDRDLAVAAALFLGLLAGFLWMPGLLILQQDRALEIAGYMATGAALIFLVRRSDALFAIVIGKVACLAIFLMVNYILLWPTLPGTAARVGVGIASLALVLYFGEAVWIAWQQRRAMIAATERAAQAQKLAAVGKLAAGVAHDFNNTLAAIQGSLELLGELDDPEERQACIDAALAASARGARTVRQLMVYAGKERMRLELQDARAVLEELVSQTAPRVPATVRVALRAHSGAMEFRADRAHLLTGLANLVGNALDAMPGGGEMTLSADPVRRETPLAMSDGSVLPPGSYVALSVSDTGSGIAPEVLPRVLDPFFTTKRVGQGSGLGLPMVLGISRDFGGGLLITPLHGGTRVTMYLPRAPEGGGSQARGSGGRRGSGGGRLTVFSRADHMERACAGPRHAGSGGGCGATRDRS